MAGTAPREGTFTRDLRINSVRAAPSDEAAVLRSPTSHSSSSLGPGPAFSEQSVSLAKTRQRRESAQVASHNSSSPAPPFGNAAGIPISTSPSHAFTHAVSPAYGADRTNSKLLLSPTGRRRSRSLFSNSNMRMTLVVLVGGFIVFFTILYRNLFHTPVLPESQPASNCEAPYDTLEPHAHPLHHTMHEGEHGDFPLHSARASIALVTMADTRKVPLPKNLAYLSDIKPGSLVNTLEVVWRNRQEYADRHGYTLVNGTDLVGQDRPPAWYKIKVAESVLDQYDWVFYLDADAWITNPEIPLEAVLPAPGGADFVVTEDAAGANAGSWVIRSSDWSRGFLSRWWGMDSFIRAPGDTKSGDNDALKHLLTSMEASERSRRIAVPPQCALNSYLWRPSFRQWGRWLTSSAKVRSGIWRPGHLLVHLAGWDNYKGLTQLQKLFVSSHDLTRRSSSGLPLPSSGLPLPTAQLSRKFLMPDAPVADVPKLSTAVPASAAVRANGANSSATTAEFTTNELSQEVAAEFAKAGAGANGAGASGAVGISLRRRASALLNDANNDLPTAPPAGGVPAPQNPAPAGKNVNAGLRSGVLWSADTDVKGDDCDDETDSSSGCEDYPDSTLPEVSGDYEIATEEQLEDLGLQLSDPDAEDMELLDEILSEDADDDSIAGEGDSITDSGSDSETKDVASDADDSVHPELGWGWSEAEEDGEVLDAESEEDLVMEIADEVAELLEERVEGGVGTDSGDTGEDDEEEDTGEEEQEEEDSTAGNDDPDSTDESVGGDTADQLPQVQEDESTAGDEGQVGSGEEDIRDGVGEKQAGAAGPADMRGVQSRQQEFLKRRANSMAGAGAASTIQKPGRSLLQLGDTAVSEGVAYSDLQGTMGAFSTESLPEQLALDGRSLAAVSKSAKITKQATKHVKSQNARSGVQKKSVKKQPVQKKSVHTYSTQRSGAVVEPVWNTVSAIVGTVQSSQYNDPLPQERGGRPYEALEEMPGEDQDYIEHSEDVHAYTRNTQRMVSDIVPVWGPATPGSIRRSTILGMSTEEIDALEEDTQLSAAAAQQMYGVLR